MTYTTTDKMNLGTKVKISIDEKPAMLRQISRSRVVTTERRALEIAETKTPGGSILHPLEAHH
jgi:hypothetical protein